MIASVDPRYDLAGWYLVRRVVKLRRTLKREPPELIDLGAGRCRDIIYLARSDFRVLGVDISLVGLERGRRMAARYGISIQTQLADIRTLRLRKKFDVVYSSCALNYLPRGTRLRRFAHFKAATVDGGIHAVNAFVAKAGFTPCHQMRTEETPFRPGELETHYQGWDLIESGEVEFDCMTRATHHRHVVGAVIARKPD